jgi:hypothetical protein
MYEWAVCEINMFNKAIRYMVYKEEGENIQFEMVIPQFVSLFTCLDDLNRADELTWVSMVELALLVLGILPVVLPVEVVPCFLPFFCVGLRFPVFLVSVLILPMLFGHWTSVLGQLQFRGHPSMVG